MIKKLFYLSIILVSIFHFRLVAETTESSSVLSKTKTMSGYELEDFEGFEKKWKQVTVRFRRDTGELRFTFANELAFETMMKNSKNYPDGAIFAKIGFKTSEDVGFPSSAVPTETRRYQFMIRNSKKFKNTDGWGYLLFDSQGYVFPEDPIVQQAACAACHRIVPERGFVFSEYLDFSPFVQKSMNRSHSEHFHQKIKFKTMRRSNLPELIRAYLPDEFKEVQVIDHEISRYLFQGTLDEIKPLISSEAVKSLLPVLLISFDNKSFSLAFVDRNKEKCELEKKNGYYVTAISLSPQQEHNALENRYCWPIEIN